jgi:anaerobic ribonucleoside-triphosphate reductase activating protein
MESDTEILAAEILSLAETIEGVSVSGGEPFQQPEALLDILERLAGTSLSRLVFSGYTLAQLADLPLGPAILRHVDVLIAGRYVASQRTGHGLLGSANQQIHRLTDRYTSADLAAVPPRELVLHRDSTVSVSGISPWRPSGT